MKSYLSPVIDNIMRVKQVVADAGYNNAVQNVIAAQSLHESGLYKSHLFLTDANSFGMKMPSIRKSPYITGKGIAAPVSEGGGNYAHYNSLEDSVKDLIARLKYGHVDFNKIQTPAGYIQELVRIGYFTATPSSYLNSVSIFFNDLSDTLEAKKKINWSKIIGYAGAGIAFLLLVFSFGLFKNETKRNKKILQSGF